LGRRLGIWTLRSPRPHVTEANVPHDWPAKASSGSSNTGASEPRIICRQKGYCFVSCAHALIAVGCARETGRAGKTRCLLECVDRAVNRDASPRLVIAYEQSPYSGNIRFERRVCQYQTPRAFNHWHLQPASQAQGGVADWNPGLRRVHSTRGSLNVP
jgi:hypothetical protein